MMRKTKSTQWVLLLLLVCGLLPVAISYSLYFGDVRFASKNYGNLLNPPVPFASWTSKRPASFVPRKWKLLVLIDNCATNAQNMQLCQQAAFLTHQIHQLLHKQYSRVQRYLVYADQNTFAQIKPTLKNQAWHYWHVKTHDANALLDLTDTQAPVLLLVDPNGNILVTYANFDAPKKILADIQHLLQVSQIG